MKFKWIGGNGHKDLDLVLSKVMSPQDILTKGRIIEIPDSETELIQRVQINGNYEVYVEPKKGGKPPKKEKQKNKEKKEDK